MSWLLAFLGFAALVILHEFGHFAAAKAVGMRVERFMLFFPPVAWKVRRGETEYGIGIIPLGGYVRITGMNPNEEIPAEHAHRAYYRQPVWKRIVVISAGPLMNVLIAFVILWGLYLTNGTATPTTKVSSVQAGQPASGVLRAGDRIVAVDGKRGDPDVLRTQISSHRCAGRQVDGCPAAVPAKLTILRAGRERVVSVTPRYDKDAKRALVGFRFDVRVQDAGPVRSARLSGEAMARVTRLTASALAGVVYSSEKRKEVSSVVGGYETTRQAFKFAISDALQILAIISLSLALINLFPFLPLDGGHIFWALAEKLRGRPIPFSVMERAGVVGFALVLMLFFIGLSNDITRLRGEGFGLR